MLIFDFYKESYYKQLERSGEFAQRLNYLFAVIFVLGGSLIYMVKPANLSNLSILNSIMGILLALSSYRLLIKRKKETSKKQNWKYVSIAIIILVFSYTIYLIVVEGGIILDSIQWIPLITTLSLLLATLYFLINLIYDYEYSYLAPPGYFEIYRDELIKKFTNAAGIPDDKKIEISFKEGLIESFIDATDINTLNNHAKSKFLHKVHTCLILATIFLMFSSVPFLILNDQKYSVVQSTQNDNTKEAAICSSSN